MANFISNTTIDLDRYSRQSYSIGQDSQIKLSEANVLIIGYNTLSQEIIKNLALLGVSKIDIYFTKKLENYQKTGLYYEYNDKIPLENLRILNPTIQINTVDILDEDKEFDKKKIKKYNTVILTNSMFEDALQLNRITHKLDIPFIMTGAYGLMGYLFNDFGDKFTINDLDGEQSELLIIDNIDGKQIKFKDEHKLSENDIIIVTWSNNTESEYQVYRKRTPLIIELKEIPNQNKLEYLKIIRKKISLTLKFNPLKKNIDNINYIIADWSFETDRSNSLHNLHLAYDKYFEKYGTSPRSWSISDYEIYKSILNTNSESKELLAKKFCYTLRGNLLPLCSIIGAIVSHEVLKALTHKYMPISQWYYMDYFDLIPDEEINNFDDNTASNYRSKTKYEGLINIFGKKFLEKVQNTKPFIVGSGAIGCELIKNLGMIGVKQIYLADPDHIEKSNLSRQFLFNDNDIRKNKAQVAAEKIKVMNIDTNINVYNLKVCSETENIFNNEFHKNIDIYLNALDNVDARIYMDTQALKYSKPLIDSGTMGSKGNVQVILPYLTESYGSTKDPDEKSGIPICTIKSFPYKSEHTIQWARELFETEFNLIPNLLNKYKDLTELNKINDSDAKILIKQLYKYKDFELKEDSYVRLLLIIFYENFEDNVKEIIEKYSKEEHKEELGDKKLPILIDINKNQMVIEFIRYGLIILNQIFSTNINFSNNIEYDRIKDDLDISLLNSERIIDLLTPIINSIPIIKPIEFEKDDDELRHVHWITTSSNLRNIQYKIEETDLFETRKIAGNIIPAMITTTSLISGFQILEYLKICKLYKDNKYNNQESKSDINLYKNRYVNLNTNYCDGINPTDVKLYDINSNLKISTWTIFKVNSNKTSDIIDQIEKYTMKKIEFMTSSNKTIFDGDEININKINEEDKNNLLILLEDVPIGIPLSIV